MAELKLLHGEVAFVDAEDLQKVVGYRWYLASNGYAMASITGKKVYLHRLILGTPTGILTDHRRHNLLDCRKKYLRQVTYKQNQGNRRKMAKATSHFKGVYWDRRMKKWAAQIGADSNGHHRVKFLGRFIDERDAAKAYNTAAIERFGDCAFLNCI